MEPTCPPREKPPPGKERIFARISRPSREELAGKSVRPDSCCCSSIRDCTAPRNRPSGLLPELRREQQVWKIGYAWPRTLSDSAAPAIPSAQASGEYLRIRSWL